MPPSWATRRIRHHCPDPGDKLIRTFQCSVISRAGTCVELFSVCSVARVATHMPFTLHIRITDRAKKRG